MSKYIMAMDAGTTSNRCILFNKKGQVCSVAQREFTQYFPHPGWVEHDADEIWACQLGVAVEAMNKIGASAEDIAAIGITNQRETAIVWDRKTGEPVYNAIVWQCRRTADIADSLREKTGVSELVAERTGLQIDAYFSATKIKWLLDHVPGAREKAERGELLFGTVETWLIWKLTGGKVHVTDYSNAGRTMLFNIHTLSWDKELCALLDIPMNILPRPVSNAEVYGTVAEGIEGLEVLAGVPICGAAGDQQAALFGQGCFARGQAKNTYGTGCFLLMNTGETPCVSRHGLVTTIAAGLGGHVTYALEGSVFVGGAVIQWLRDEMRFLSEASDAEYYAQKVPSTGGVYFVPAFTGLGAPYWDMYARGAIVGITRGTKREHIIRAAQESIAYQSMDLVAAMEKDTGVPLRELRVDGGASRDAFLMQFQADMLATPVRRPVIRETTALGAAYLAGLAVGIWHDPDELRRQWRCDVSFLPHMTAEQREKNRRGWAKAVGRSLDWAREE